MACRRMKAVQKWAVNRWKEDLRLKLTCRSAWWSCIKQQQGFSPDDCTPPLNKPDGSAATSSREKADLLASLFSEKMRVHDPDRSAPSLPLVTHSKLSSFVITEAEVRQHLNKVDVHKAIGPDKRSASDLLLHLTTIWHQALDTRKDTIVVALDIAGAFDSVWHKGLASKMKSFGIDGNLLMLLEDYSKKGH
ncbi:uncharacterized protein LOC125036956 [Penaeus chinensis]|uniref:uncharacterized protein LOC125036956 n=1 Tax=Penaeus chinensis TaxID=139456 RepID=UPI001FB6A11B|nr:uncharacterized protein LOC125036956 [Penaeus chinensis]